MNQMVKYGFILAGICFAAALVLSLVYRATEPKIEEARRREEEAARRELLPAAEAFEKRSAGGMEYYAGLSGGRAVGYCFPASGRGYGGFLKLMVGIDPEGKIAGVRVLEHQETPGLGAKIVEVRPGESEPWFLAAFRGLPARRIGLKDIQAITGATITSRAVVEAVRGGAESFPLPAVPEGGSGR